MLTYDVYGDGLLYYQTCKGFLSRLSSASFYLGAICLKTAIHSKTIVR